MYNSSPGENYLFILRVYLLSSDYKRDDYWGNSITFSFCTALVYPEFLSLS